MVTSIENSWPVLAQSYRGQCGQNPCVETNHFGAFAVVSGKGELICSAGDASHMTHFRSTAKPFQLLPFMLDGLDGKVFENGQIIDSADISLLMASHYGEEQHTARIRRLLDLSKLSQANLLCGIHPPFDKGTRRNLLRTQESPSVVHSNCSGKHLAMLMVCQKNHWPLATYLEENHPLQQRIKHLILSIANAVPSQLGIGVDGCNLPTFVLPLQSIATAYAEFACPSPRLAQEIRHALSKLFAAGISHPEMIGGSTSFDTALMQALPQQIFVKSGADGVLAMAIASSKKYSKGLGVAIKIADGDFSKKVRPLVAIEILRQLEILPLERSAFDEKLAPWISLEVTNLSGFKTGFWKLVF